MSRLHNNQSMKSFSQQSSKFHISRRGRKLQVSDDPRVLIAMPKDIHERTWAEVLQKEENDLVCLDIREEIVEEALRIGFDHYMERQNAFFVVHCAAEAWLKLIEWQFYRHDPGEDPSAYPPAFIPCREESWVADDPPAPSPKDSWSRAHLTKLEECKYDEDATSLLSSDSLDLPVVADIPEKYWFPAKVRYKTYYVAKTGNLRRETNMTDLDGNRIAPLIEERDENGEWARVSVESLVDESSDHVVCTESEVLQKVTDYSTEDMRTSSHLMKTGEEGNEGESNLSTARSSAAVEGSLHGAGDSTLEGGDGHPPDQTSAPAAPDAPAKRRQSRVVPPSSHSVPRGFACKSRHGGLPPLDSDSIISMISDCRLRNLRLDTQFEVSQERIESPFGTGGSMKKNLRYK